MDIYRRYPFENVNFMLSLTTIGVDSVGDPLMLCRHRGKRFLIACCSTLLPLDGDTSIYWDAITSTYARLVHLTICETFAYEVCCSKWVRNMRMYRLSVRMYQGVCEGMDFLSV
jgi:hypothetical protein